MACYSGLNGWADDGLQRSQGWPKAPHSLSGALKRVAPDLAVVGITVVFDHHKQRLITISRSPRESDGSDVSDGGKEGRKDVATKPAERRRATSSDGRATSPHVQNVAAVATVAKKRPSTNDGDEPASAEAETDEDVALAEYLQEQFEAPAEGIRELAIPAADGKPANCWKCSARPRRLRPIARDGNGTDYVCSNCGASPEQPRPPTPDERRQRKPKGGGRPQ